MPKGGDETTYFAMFAASNDEIIPFPLTSATFNSHEENGQIVFRYCDENGDITDAANPNGARSNIAGICNQNRNVLGMMPHPERACEEMLGSNDGRDIFRSLAHTIASIAA